jgi:hypothetical protein
MKSLWKVNGNLSGLATFSDVDWSSVERDVLNKRVNIKQLCEKYGCGVTQPTFKVWFTKQFASKWTIHWGRPGRGNYIRSTHAQDGSTLLAQLEQLESRYGKDALRVAMLQFALGDN